MTHFSKVTSSAIQRTFSEGEGSSKVASYMGQNIQAVGCFVDGPLVHQTIHHKP